MVTLSAYKFGIMLQVARELIDDTAVDLLGYLAMQAGRAIGNNFGTARSTARSACPAAWCLRAAGVTGSLSSAISGAVTGVSAAPSTPTWSTSNTP